MNKKSATTRIRPRTDTYGCVSAKWAGVYPAFNLFKVKKYNGYTARDFRAGFTPSEVVSTSLPNTSFVSQRNIHRTWAIKPRQLHTGFTLIELLVVISLIALFASVVLASLNTARAKARDAQILSDIRTLETVMELYYDDHGEYPPAVAEKSNIFAAAALTEIRGDGTDPLLKSQLLPYLKQLPNPSKYFDSAYKWSGWGFGWGNSGISRISYNRPWSAEKDMIYNETGVRCDPLSWGNSKNCYILTIRTETKTTLGPAEVKIYIITGKNGRGKIIEGQNRYYQWGLY